MKFARIGQALVELPPLVARQLHVGLIELQGADLLASRHLRLFVEVVPTQHLNPVAWVSAVAGDQGNLLLWNVVDIELGCQRMAEGVEPDSFFKAKALQVATKVHDELLAVTRVGFPCRAVHARREQREQSGVAGGFHVLQELQEARLQKWLRDRDDTHAARALHALPAAPPAFGVCGQVLVHRLLKGNTPDAALLDDVGQLQLADLIDASTGVETDHRCPPILRLLVGPWQEVGWVEDGLKIFIFEKPDGLLWVDGGVFLDLPEGLHGRRDDGLSIDQVVEEGDQEAAVTFLGRRGQWRHILLFPQGDSLVKTELLEQGIREQVFGCPAEQFPQFLNVVVVHSGRGDIAAGEQQQLQRALGGQDSLRVELAATHVFKMVFDLFCQGARRRPHGQLRGVARAVFKAALSYGFVERRKDAFLQVDGGFSTSDDGAVNAEPSDVDALQMQKAERRGDVIVECGGGQSGHGSLPSIRWK